MKRLNYGDRFLALQPNAVLALFNKGFALMMLHRYSEALELARETFAAGAVVQRSRL